MEAFNLIIVHWWEDEPVGDKRQTKQFKNILAWCHASFSNVYKGITQNVNIDMLSQIVPWFC